MTDYLGKTVVIRGVKHICIAARENDLLLLEMDGDRPVQYVVAHSVYRHEDGLCWLNGDYFPLPLYPDSLTALINTLEAMR